MRSWFVTSLAVLALTGCRGDVGDDDTGDAGGPPDGGTTTYSIYDIQTPGNGITEGTRVTLTGVVVTAIDSYGDRLGGFYAQEPGGGAYSGVFVYSFPDQSANLAEGDIVTISGNLSEYAYTTDTTGRKLTEIAGNVTVVKTGTGSLPAPALVDPSLVAYDLDEMEKWEGVLVQLSPERVVEAPDSVSTSDPTLKEMRVGGPFSVGSGLSSIDAAMLDDCVSVTGVVDYFYAFTSAPAWPAEGFRLLPRKAGDLVIEASTACTRPATEDPATTCTDNMDNDGDSFKDCADRDCWTLAACFQDNSIADVQTMPSLLNANVRVTGAVVTAMRSGTNGLVWIQEAGTVNAGVVVRLSSGLPGTLALGDIVTVSGRVVEYYMETQIDNATIMETGSGPELDPTTVTVAQLANATTAEQYEGMLIEVVDQRVVDPPDTTAYNQFTVGTTTEKAYVGNYLYQPIPMPLPSAGQCYAQVSGPLRWTCAPCPGPSTYKIMPRRDSDIPAGTNCP